MADNDLNSFSKIYYKNVIKIDDNLTENEKEDIRTFFLINRYIKVINIAFIFIKIFISKPHRQTI